MHTNRCVIDRVELLPKWECAGGNCSPLEVSNRVNYLEILAVLFALKSFSSELKSHHVKVLIDNTTAVACINQIGTRHLRSIYKLTCKSGPAAFRMMFG